MSKKSRKNFQMKQILKLFKHYSLTYLHTEIGILTRHFKLVVRLSSKYGQKKSARGVNSCAIERGREYLDKVIVLVN